MRKIRWVRTKHWFLLALLLVILSLVTYLKPFRVISQSMAPTINKGDLLIGTAIWLKKPEEFRGKIIIFNSPEDNDLNVKRVLAVPGDKIEIKRNKIYINNRDQGLVDYADRTWQMKQDEFFVVGDNRGNSRDSLDFGPINKEAIRAVTRLRYYPLKDIGSVQ